MSGVVMLLFGNAQRMIPQRSLEPHAVVLRLTDFVRIKLHSHPQITYAKTYALALGWGDPHASTTDSCIPLRIRPLPQQVVINPRQ